MWVILLPKNLLTTCLNDTQVSLLFDDYWFKVRIEYHVLDARPNKQLLLSILRLPEKEISRTYTWHILHLCVGLSQTVSLRKKCTRLIETYSSLQALKTLFLCNIGKPVCWARSLIRLKFNFFKYCNLKCEIFLIVISGLSTQQSTRIRQNHLKLFFIVGLWNQKIF